MNLELNKQISVWRGNSTPPTDYHLWIKENGDILINISDNWDVVATTSNLESLSTLLEKVENLKIQEVETDNSSTFKSYSLVYDGLSKGTIDIPKDRFLKNVLYDLSSKKLIFTFITSDGTDSTQEISVSDLVDVYKAGNNVTIKDNTISVDFSPITLALNTKVNKSDFDYVVKVNDDNKGNIINAKQVINNQTTGVSNNYDLILGNKDENDSYILIDSTRSKSPVNLNKFGNINIYSAGTTSLKAANNMSIDGGHVTISSDSTTIYGNNFKFKLSPTESASYFGYDDCTFSVFGGNDFLIMAAPAIASESQGEDKVTFLDSSIQLFKNRIRIFDDDSILFDKNKNIKFKTSSSNTMRLTEGEGFKVFANMYAEPDHATDITDYTDEEKALLSSNTVQKILLDTNKTLNLKADSSTLNNYVLLNNVDAELSEISVNPVLNKAVKAAIYNLNQETSTLSQKLNTKADSSSLNNYLPLTGGTISNSLNVTGTLTTGGKSVLTSHLPIYKLTLLKNGSNVGTFTPTNADSTLNISVPTKLSELTDDIVSGKYLPLAGGTITNNLIVNGKITLGGNNVLDISTTNISDLTIKINNVSRTIPTKLSQLTNDIVEACTTNEINALFE